MEEKYKGPERREAVRLEKDFPVEYNLINDVKSIGLSKKQKGIIRNISAQGVRLEIEELDESWLEGLYSGLIKLGLEMHLPKESQPIRALAKAIWLTKTYQETGKTSFKYVLGLEFIDITNKDQDRIKDYILNSYLGGDLE